MRSVGIVGLGHMGIAIARRVIAAGHPLTVTNRTKEKASSLLQLGADWSNSPAELAEKCDIIISILSDDSAVKQVLVDGRGTVFSGLAPAKLLLEMSTISPETALMIHERAKGVEVQMLHCPVLGGPANVYNGKATIFVGGEKSVYQSAFPVLEDISSPVHFVGDVKKAAYMKLTMNIMLTHFFFGVASSLNFARNAKLPPYLVNDIISRIAEPVVSRMGEKILNGDEGVTFSVENYEKDQRYFLSAAKELGIRLPSIEAIQKFAKEALDHGWGDKDFTTMNKLLFTGGKKA